MGKADSDSTEFVIHDALVLTMDEERNAHDPGWLWVRDGLIAGVGAGRVPDRIAAEVPRHSASGRLLMPGLVNTHGHLSNGILRGIYDEMPLAVWFERGMWPVLEALDREAGAAGARLALLEQMLAGVTTTMSAEFGTPNPGLADGVLEAIGEAGIRAVVSRMTVDSAVEDSPTQAVPARYRERPEDACREVERLQKTWRSERVSIAAEALGVLRCSPAMIEAMHDLATRSGSLFTMHVASSEDEHRECHQRHGRGCIAQLEELGVLGSNALLAHVIWLDPDELQLLAERDTAVSHNPVANAYYASGHGDLAALLGAGVRTGLGLDGASTNNSQNLWETMKAAILNQKQQSGDAGFGSAELALELATRGGAAALGMAAQTGSLEPGRKADFIIIDPERPALTPRQTLVSNLVYSSDPGAVRDVYVGGERIVRDGVHQRLSFDEVLAGANEAMARVLERTGLDDYLDGRGSWRWHRG